MPAPYQSYPPSLWAQPDPSTITGLAPNNAEIGAAPFVVTVTGTGFSADTVISFDGDERPTTFLSATQVSAGVASPVAPARTVQVSASTGGSAPFAIVDVAVPDPEPEPEPDPTSEEPEPYSDSA
jgi:hypothetical protein